MPLLVCATPIGNLEDVTLRVLRELAEADLVLCEDTRRTRVLLDRHGIHARLVSFERHMEARRTAEVVPLLEAGDRVALVSDAGLPAVNDPGQRLIAAAHERGLPVVVLPGPSAVETALVASGLVADRYQFLGFLPRGETALAALWNELGAWLWPAVAFESPKRLSRSLASLASMSQPAGWPSAGSSPSASRRSHEAARASSPTGSRRVRAARSRSLSALRSPYEPAHPTRRTRPRPSPSCVAAGVPAARRRESSGGWWSCRRTGSTEPRCRHF